MTTAFTAKDWHNSPDATTPISATALEDMENRLAAYALLVAQETAAAGIELGYAETTAALGQTGAGSTDVPGLTLSVTIGSRPVVVRVGASGIYNSSASGITQLKIMEGATTLAACTSSLTTVVMPAYRDVRLTPTAGAHTYKVQLTQLITGNSQMSAGATDPAYIQVLEV